MNNEQTLPNDRARFMTKREDFAKAAMQGILANPDWVNRFMANTSDDDFLPTIVQVSVLLADDLINQLNKQP